jgi:proteasome lid subunit RPN8/RPN11
METYRYMLDLLAEDGTVLGQVGVEPDWEPVLECASFAAIRRGLLPPSTATVPGAVEPVWDEKRGRPLVSGFRVRIDGLGDTDGSLLGVSYLSALARQASLDLVERGALQPGAPFLYRVSAFPVEAPSGAGEPATFDVEEVASPLPVEERSLGPLLAASARWGEAADAEEMTVLVPRRVLDEAMALARRDPETESGGILVGKLSRDPETAEIFLEVTAQIPARHALSHATKLTFTAETWAAAEAAMRLRRRGEIMCGWFHDHLDWCRRCPEESRWRCTASNAFFSADDAHLHRVCFGRAYQVALLISDSIRTGMTWSLYGWRRGTVEPRGFHILETEGD